MIHPVRRSLTKIRRAQSEMRRHGNQAV
jgi:hypothetical protein